MTINSVVSARPTIQAPGRILPSFSWTFTQNLLFCTALATIATLLGYSFGAGNQIEHLPGLYRLIDPGYCPGDFFVNATSASGPRIYYIHLLARLSGLLPATMLFLMLTWLVNLATLLITSAAARDLLGENPWVTPVACLLLLIAKGTDLGGTGGRILPSTLNPANLILPLNLICIWAALRGRPLICAAAACLASPIHPLTAAEAGAIGLGVIGLTSLKDLCCGEKAVAGRQQRCR